MVRPTDHQLKTNAKREMHPNSLKNLEKRKSWKPGQSGNPKGCPPAKTNLRTYVRIFVSMSCEEFKAVDTKGLTIGEFIAYGHVVKMLRDAAAKASDNIGWQRVKEEFDRDEGQPDVSLTVISPEIAAMDDNELNVFLREAAIDDHN